MEQAYKPNPVEKQGLTLQDGTAWTVEASDDYSRSLVAQLVRVMGLGPSHRGDRSFLVRAAANQADGYESGHIVGCHGVHASEPEEADEVCTVRPNTSSLSWTNTVIRPAV